MIYLFSFSLSLFSVFLLSLNKSVEFLYWILLLFAGFFVFYVGLFFGISYLITMFVKTSKNVNKVNYFFYFLMLAINEFICDSARVKVQIKNKELFDKSKNYIIVCDHRSKFDSMIIANEFQESYMCFVSKPENFKIPMVGKIIYKCGYKAIDRNDNRKALKTIIDVCEFVKNNKINYGIFPEGTRNKSARGLLEFRNGCFKLAQKTQNPICVMTIKNSHKIAKNFPLKKTNVILDIVEILPPEIYNNMSSAEIGNHIREKMLTSLNEK